MGAQGSKGNAPAKKKKYKGHLIQTMDDHDGGVNCMALSEDGSVLATGNIWLFVGSLCICFVNSS